MHESPSRRQWPAKEGVWISKFLIELGVFSNASSPVDLYCDNSGAIAQAKEPRNNQKSKHVMWRFHLIREFIDRGEINKVFLEYPWMTTCID